MTPRAPRALPLGGIVLATALFVALQALLGAVADPTGFYAQGSEPVLPAGGSPAPGRGSLSPAVVAALIEAPFVEKAVPQTFLYTVVDGLPIVLRGADLDALLDLHGARIATGEMPPRGSPTLLVGERLATRLGIDVGDVLLVPASSGGDLLVERVAGIVQAPTGLRDELLVDEATGLRLAGLAPGAASFVEVRPRDPDALHAWLAQSRDTSRVDIVGPEAARVGANVTLRVVDAAGAPVADATLRAGQNETARTNERGEARVVAHEGRTRWLVEINGETRGEHHLLGARESDGVFVTGIDARPAFPIPGRAFSVDVHVQTFSREPATRNVSLRIDGEERTSAPASLGPGARGIVTVALDGLDAGTYTLAVDDLEVDLVVATPEALQAQWRLVPTAAPLRSVTMRDALDDVFGSVALAALLLGSLAFLLFFVGNAALFARVVHEREGDLHLMRALGGSRAQVRLFAMQAFGPVAAASAAAGLLGGALAAEAVTRLDVVTLFGHTLRVHWGAQTLATLALLALLCTVGAVALAVETFLRREDARVEKVRPASRAADDSSTQRAPRNRHLLIVGALAFAALAVRTYPLLVSPLPYNIDGFAIARTAEDFLATRTIVPDTHETSRPGALVLLAIASWLTRVPPLALTQPFFTALGFASVLVTWRVARRALGGDARAGLFALSVLAFLGSYVYFSAAAMKQATGFVLVPVALGLLVMGRSRAERLAGAAALLALPLFHHFVAFLAVAALALSLVAFAAVDGWRRVPRHIPLALAPAAAWTMAWTWWRREPIGSSWELISGDAWIYVSILALVALAVYATARRPRSERATFLALATAPALGTLALLAHASRPVFEGAYTSPPSLLAAAPFYGVVLVLAAWGIALVLRMRDHAASAFCLGLLGSVVALLLFAPLRGLDAASFYLAQRTVDFVVPVVAVGYGAAAAWACARFAQRSAPAARVATVLLLLLPAATLPIALADADGLAFGRQVTPEEFDALAWAAANADGPISTDTRYGHVMATYFRHETRSTLAYDLAHGARASGWVVVAYDWATRGGEAKPLGTYRVDVDALVATCDVRHTTETAFVAVC